MANTREKKRDFRGYLNGLLLGAVIMITASCGGGGGDGGDTVGSVDEDGVIGTGIVRGTAATGAAIASATIEAKSDTGAAQSATTDSAGKYEIDSLAAGAWLLRVDQGNGQYLYGIAHSDGKAAITRNLHPFTDLIVRNWFSRKGTDIDTAFASGSSSVQMPTEKEINAIEQEINAVIAQVLVDYGVDEEIDLLATPFEANSTGFDLFLDKNHVLISGDTVSVVVLDQVTNIQNVVINIGLGADLTSERDEPPAAPDSVRALPAGGSEIVVVWEAASDDKGVAYYNVYRNGTLLGTTPYPVYSDTAVEAGTAYRYEIQAVDGRGQESAKSASTPDLVLDQPDTTAPPVPAALTATAAGGTVTLSWTQSRIDDVYGFRILRGTKGNANTEVANITATSYTDFSLASGEHCYRVVAYDAAGNTSDASVETCATVDGGSSDGLAAVSFSASSYTVSETQAQITISIDRSGDLSQPASVDYSVTGGTATAGDDFTAVSGTLHWAANEGGAKTFTVQIAQDGVSEGDETATLALSNPVGVGLGTATATLSITDGGPVVCNGVLNEDISVDTTLSEPCYKVTKSVLYVENPATLTINPGVRLEFAAGTQLAIRQGAAMKAAGTAASPIVFTAGQPTPGYWKGIEFYGSNSTDNRLAHVVVEYGETNVIVDSALTSSRVSIEDVTLRHAQYSGFYFDSDSIIGAFSRVTSTANGRPGKLPANLVYLLGNDSSYSGNTDDRIHVFREEISREQTWKKLDVPYFLNHEGGFYNVKAALTLEPGVTLIFNSGIILNIDSSGSLTAVGTEAEPILFTGQEQSPGYWTGLLFRSSNSINNKLDHVTVEYGEINVDTVTLSSYPTRLGIRNTLLRHASDLGLFIDGGSLQLDVFENNTLTQNGRPIALPASMVGDLGSDSSYSGNTDDRIHVFREGISREQTWKKLDVPYFLNHEGGYYDVKAALTLESGVTLIFNSGITLHIDDSGSLTAVGTEAEPILFTGQGQSPGYWTGLRFNGSNSINNKLDYVTVEYAGDGNPSESGNISTYCWSSSPTRLSVTNSTIKDSFGWGIYRYGSEADGCYITLSGNTYGNNASGDVNTP